MPLDIATGIFIALGASEWFGADLSWSLLLFSIISALLPDADLFLAHTIPGQRSLGRILGGHRGLMHSPAFYVFPTIVVFAAFGTLWAAVFAAGVFAHLLHDTLFLGWGIAWLWPYAKRRFKFFPDKDGRIPKRLHLSWLPHEERAIRAEWGSQNWVRDFYLRPSIVSVLEYGAFACALLILLFQYSK